MQDLDDTQRLELEAWRAEMRRLMENPESSAAGEADEIRLRRGERRLVAAIQSERWRSRLRIAAALILLPVVSVLVVLEFRQEQAVDAVQPMGQEPADQGLPQARRSVTAEVAENVLNAAARSGLSPKRTELPSGTVIVVELTRPAEGPLAEEMAGLGLKPEQYPYRVVLLIEKR
jgi:type II secretory pathway component PulL